MVYGVEVQGQYLFLTALDCGASKKDATFLADQARSIIETDEWSAGFGNHIIAFACDGAGSCKNCSEILCRSLHIVPLRCQLHAMGLVIKHISVKIPFFADLIERAEKLLDLFLSNGRLRALLKTFSDGRALIRFVPVWMAIHVVAVMRLLALKSAIVQTCDSKQFEDYVSDPPPERRSRCRYVKDIVDDSTFWKSVRFCVDSMTPLVVTLRIFDRSCAMAGYIYWMWSLLRESMCVVFGGERNDWVPV